MMEGEIVEWLVAVGDAVELDQPICSVETDKSVVEMTSPYRGTMLALGGEPGDVIAVGEALVVVGEPGEELPVAESALDASLDASSGNDASSVSLASADVALAAAAGAADVADANRAAADETVKVLPRALPRVLPKIRKLARDLGVDLAAVAGTGPGGAISAADVESASLVATADAMGSASPRRGSGSEDEAEAEIEAKAGIEAKSGDEAEVPARRERLSATRRSIARHMNESAQIPQFTAMVDTNASRLLTARAQVSTDSKSPVPLDALLVNLMVSLLRDHPIMNAALYGDEITYFNRYDIGVAVDTAEGLIVPVVQGADNLSLAELSAEILRLVAAVRNRTAEPHELTGATSTVNNIGALGLLAGTPLLPTGTSMIAAFGMARPVLQLVESAPVEAPTMTVSATFDHRIIDGGTAGRFLAQLKETIENPPSHS